MSACMYISSVKLWRVLVSPSRQKASRGTYPEDHEKVHARMVTAVRVSTRPRDQSAEASQDCRERRQRKEETDWVSTEMEAASESVGEAEDASCREQNPESRTT
ncbi:hypothetical protein AcV5_002742 [Taiwanofungus camphoratus]|nr:hypothetical protein AcV5_002742 [Antrodia cinnamomea]